MDQHGTTNLVMERKEKGRHYQFIKIFWWPDKFSPTVFVHLYFLKSSMDDLTTFLSIAGFVSSRGREEEECTEQLKMGNVTTYSGIGEGEKVITADQDT